NEHIQRCEDGKDQRHIKTATLIANERAGHRRQQWQAGKTRHVDHDRTIFDPRPGYFAGAQVRRPDGDFVPEREEFACKVLHDRVGAVGAFGAPATEEEDLHRMNVHARARMPRTAWTTSVTSSSVSWGDRGSETVCRPMLCGSGVSSGRQPKVWR